jgi:aspartyl protease family protein
MTLSEGEDGHYHVYGTINGVKILFLIDTGANDIVLDPTDARRIGLKLEDLNFNRPFGSANGIGHGAGIEVDELVIGPIRFTRVPMSVNGARMGSSLLGMAFLKRLKSYSFSGGKLTLRW